MAVKVVWITLLAMADKDGKVEGSIPGLAVRAGVSLQECEAALEKFKSPDKYSRTQENEGRRIVDADGGWILLNHGKYRAMMSTQDRRDYQRLKQREYRERKKSTGNGKTAEQVKAENQSRMQRFVQAEGDGDDAEADRIAAEGL